jgi:hypothetical protein
MFVPKNPSQFGRKIAVEELGSAHLHDALALWRRKRGPNRYPRREDIAPSDMKSFLRYVTLLRALDGGCDFEFRIAGDGMIVAYGGNNPIGKRLSEFSREFVDASMAALRSVLRHREPLAVKGTMEKSEVESLLQETLFLPLGVDETAVDHVLVVSCFVQQFAGTISGGPADGPARR